MKDFVMKRWRTTLGNSASLLARNIASQLLRQLKVMCDGKSRHKLQNG